MTTFVVFIISLVLLTFLFFAKSLEVYYGKKIFLEKLFLKCDVWILKAVRQSKYWWSHVNFKNTKFIFSWLIVSIRRISLLIKRRFDHKQSSFFAKREPDVFKTKGSVSFFLKNVSDYKKSLREGSKRKKIDLE